MKIEAMTPADYDEVRALWLSCEGIGRRLVDLCLKNLAAAGRAF
jgi:hypothetical protein